MEQPHVGAPVSASAGAIGRDTRAAGGDEMPLTLPSLELFCSPPGRGAPDDIRGPIIESIDSTRKILRLVSQQLEHAGIVNALIRAKRRGVDVAVALERDYLYERTVVDNPWRRVRGGNERNRTILLVLMRAGIPVFLERRNVLLHSNFILCDKEVLVSSANFTPTGLTVHMDGLLRFRSPVLAARFAEEFDKIVADTVDTGTDAPAEVRLGRINAKLVFGPRHAPEMEIMKQMLKAAERIDIAIFTFSTSSGIDDTLLALATRGIAIRMVMDSDQVNQSWSAAGPLARAGVQIGHIGGKASRLHHKMVVIDDKVVVFGTFNFTAAARLSHESIIVLGEHVPDPTPATRRAEKNLTDYVREEVDRLFSLATPVT